MGKRKKELKRLRRENAELRQQLAGRPNATSVVVAIEGREVDKIVRAVTARQLQRATRTLPRRGGSIVS